MASRDSRINGGRPPRIASAGAISSGTPHPDAHLPVLLSETVDLLVTDNKGVYIDGTFGRGGHSRAILARLSPQGRLLALDKDPQAVACAQTLNDPRLDCRHASFTELAEVVSQAGITQPVSGIVLDLGVSSPQLMEAARGFSFLQDGPLDMRMDPTQGQSVATWLATVPLRTLTQVIAEYGEERYAPRIARAIIDARKTRPLTHTLQLAGIIKAAHPRWPKDKHPATRTFQALRIFINQELAALRVVLPQCLALLKKGGRLAVISFHSLEDRIVKQFIQQQTRGDAAYQHFPLLIEKFIPRLRAIGRPVHPGAAEILANPRSRSAILRIVEKMT